MDGEFFFAYSSSELVMSLRLVDRLIVMVALQIVIILRMERKARCARCRIMSLVRLPNKFFRVSNLCGTRIRSVQHVACSNSVRLAVM